MNRLNFGIKDLKFKSLCIKLQNEKDLKIKNIQRIMSNHRKEFENTSFGNFCDNFGILHEFSAPRTPQQNGVVERKNRVLQEMDTPLIVAYRVFNSTTHTIMESSNVVVDDAGIVSNIDDEYVVENSECACFDLNVKEDETKEMPNQTDPAPWVRRSHKKDNIIGDVMDFQEQIGRKWKCSEEESKTSCLRLYTTRRSRL
ncbi:hypothetical protein ACOSP7_009889 [Xanthoceras sorbifolium]